MTQTNKNGTLPMRVACAIFFLLFTFLYLYNYQDDILAVAQHVLSQGATHYNRTIGAVIITLVLWLLQLALYAFTGLTRRCHALTYLPSLLLMGALTSASPDILSGHCSVLWLWLFPLLMVVYGFIVWVVRQLESIEPEPLSQGFFTRMVWVNLLQMVVMALITCGIGNSDKVFHYRMHLESDLLDGNYADALRVGQDDAATDSSLTMLRIAALSSTGELGERLFTYPLVGRSDAMLPNGQSVRLAMVPETWLYKKIGVVFKEKVSPRRYLELAHEKGYAKHETHDWLLTAYLLDGDLDAFAHALPRYYNVSKPLPLHYREALVLYTHLRQHPFVVFHSQVMEADFDDFLNLLHSTHDAATRRYELRSNYGKTYWYYYYSHATTPSMHLTTRRSPISCRW
jgi:hypothetical protein